MLKFLAFTDFHYEKMRFSTTVEDLTEIIGVLDPFKHYEKTLTLGNLFDCFL